MGNLTRSSDKLYAIAGLAKVFLDKFGEPEYLAGL